MLVVVFDVESVGLHGEGFAVGAVVVDVALPHGDPLDTLYACAHHGAARGSMDGHTWIQNNLPRLAVTQESTHMVRNAFWSFWTKWREKGAFLAADCAWPVEANFLSACIADQPIGREWLGPYPLLDLASMIWLRGGDPTAAHARLDNEVPIHDPLADARQSARLLVEAYNRQGGARLA